MVSSIRADPLVTVILPTHDHASTLDLAVTSVLNQTLDAVEVVIIGDGVGDDTRDVVSSLVSDRRVRFIDTPKSPSRAEFVRHAVLCQARTPYVCYLGDDDLMLSDHVESTVERLQAVDLTHSFPAFIERDGSLGLYLTDIADQRCVAWHLRPACNAISLTGVGHRLNAYLALPVGWREPPPGIWSDHYMWQQWFRVSSLRFNTGDTMTVLKFYESARKDMTSAERRNELLNWLEKSKQPGFASTLAAEAVAVVRREAIRLAFDQEAASNELADVRKSRELIEAELAAVQKSLLLREDELDSARNASEAHAVEAERAQAAVRALQATLEAVRRTRTWRFHDWLARSSAVRWIAHL